MLQIIIVNMTSMSNTVWEALSWIALIILFMIICLNGWLSVEETWKAIKNMITKY